MVLEPGRSKMVSGFCEKVIYMPERIPPHNIEAEQSILGALLIDQEAMTKIADILIAEDFYKETHGQIFQAMLDIYDKREPLDILSAAGRLNDKGILETIGGRTYLAELSNLMPTASNIVYYAKIVQNKATLRRLLKTSSDISELGFTESEDVDKILDEAEQRLFSVSQKFLKKNFISISSVLQDAFERIDELHKAGGKMRGLPTGFIDLDNLLAGLQKSNLIILAARPSVGKTSLALDIARYAAVEQKAKVGIFSLEMSKEELTDRLLCAEANVGLWKMRTGKLSQEDFPAIGEAMGALSESPIFIDDSATLNIMEIRTKARRLKAEHNLDLIVLDYLQLMEGRNKESRVQEVAEITRALKSIARELEIPVLALSQLSRAVEMRSGAAIPKLADLRESGTIEQDADVVMFIYRKIMDKNQNCPEDERSVAEVHIAKHRNGPTGVIKLFFDEQRVTFKNLEKNH